MHTTSPEVTETALELLKAVVAEDEGLSLKMVSGTQICDTLVNHIVGRWQRGREFEEHRSVTLFVIRPSTQVAAAICIKI